MTGIPSRINAAQALYALANRKRMLAHSDLQRSSSLPFPVVLSFNDVEMFDSVMTIGAGGGIDVQQRVVSEPSPTLTDTLTETVSGQYELWFDHDGRAMISFADEGDAVLFACGRKGVVS